MMSMDWSGSSVKQWAREIAEMMNWDEISERRPKSSGVSCQFSLAEMMVVFTAICCGLGLLSLLSPYLPAIFANIASTALLIALFASMLLVPASIASTLTSLILREDNRTAKPGRRLF